MQVELIGRPADFEEIDDEQADGFSQRRNAALQRSQDSGALTDWSGGSRGSPTRQSCHSRDSLERDEHKYVTVLSVNGGLDLDPDRLSGKDAVDLPDFVTVLSVGTQPKVVADDDPVGLVGSVCLSLAGFVEETAIIGRQAGQKLGFGLKFDGGHEKERTVDRLYVQCCAEGSPASKVRCSWGRLVEADEIIEIDGVVIRDTLNRQQVVAKLKDGQEILSLKIRHYWDENKRRAIMEQLNNPKVVIDQQIVESSVTRKTSLRHPQQQQERAVDVPEELLIQSVLRNNGKHVWKNEDAPPPVPPRRKRRTKLSVKDHGLAAGCKTAVSRSLSSDQVLINGSRVAASSAVTTPSKPPRNRPQQSRSFNAKHNNNNKESQIDPVVIAPTTLPRTKELSNPPRPEPRERHRQSSVLIVNAGHEPQPAEVYVNLIAEEDKRLSMDAATESESESSSSVSTVVDTWSVSSSSGDPFGDFSEQEEYRELRGTDLLRGILRSENMAGFVKEATPAEMIEQVPSESTLSVLIEPPETFLDNEPTSISPTGHLDASSDSGASSGGSELHLVESDEELRVFQQVETALELGHDCHAISLPSSESDHSLDSDDIKRPESPQMEDAICVPNVEPCASTEDNEERDKKIRRQDEEGGNPKSPTKMEHPPNNNKKNSSRSNLNRTPLRSRIPQAVSTPPSSRVMTTTIKNGNSGAVVPASSTASSHRVVGRPVANNKTSGIVVPKVVKSPVRHHNSNLNISRGVSPTKLTTTPNTKQVSATTTTTTASSNLPKSVKPGLPVNSKIPRPSSGAQPKSSPSASSARPLTGTARPHPSLLLPRTGVKPSSSLHPLHKSTSRLHLTHNNKGESLRADLISAH